MNWHSLQIKKILEDLKVDLQLGLKEEEVAGRKIKYGENKLATEKKLADLRIFLNQFKNPLIYILVVAFLVTLFLKDYIDSIVIAVAVLLNAVLGFFQERKASDVLELLRKAATPVAIVLRGGAPKRIFASEVVVGDIILLKEGDRVPADIRLFEADNLKTNEASLTGESWPVEKDFVALRDLTPIFERKNMVFLGTAVVEGRGGGIIVSVGKNTEFGKISEQLSEIKEEETPLQKKIRKLSFSLAIFISIIVASIFFTGVILGENILEMFLTAVALTVAAIPEGLPIGVSVALAVGMQRILKKRGLIRKLNSVETLGSATIICMDKTGTLTEGEMQVSKILTGTTELLREDPDFKNLANISETFGVSGNSAESPLRQSFSEASHILALKIGALVSDVLIEHPKENEAVKYILHGDPLEKAVVLAAMHAGFSKEDLERQQPRLKFLPFSPVRKYMASLNRYSQNKKIIYIMGAPENVLDLSSQIEIDGHQEALGEKWKGVIEGKLENLTGKGLRVVAVAYKSLESPEKEIQREKFDFEFEIKNIVFVGFIGFSDPLRPEVKETLQAANKAGIRAIIITGDHKSTAEVIAREAGFVFDKTNVLEGKDLDNISDEKLEKIVDKIVIYARAVPSHKLRIIHAWQSRGEVVAMTGDGVNDAPALKKADVGVALGSGTEVAKQASDLVLLDDSFAIIVSAIRQGRIIFDNIKKVTIFILKDAFTEINLIILSIIFGLPLPLLPAQILWINLFQDSLPAFAFAMEPGEEEVMDERPKQKEASLLDREMKILIFIYGISSDLVLFVLFTILNKTNGDIAHTRTLVFMLLALGSLSSIFSIKSLRKSIFKINIFSNHYLVLSFIVGLILMILAVYFEPLQGILRTVPLSARDWLIVVGFAIFNIIFIEIIKLFFRNGNKNKVEKI